MTHQELYDLLNALLKKPWFGSVKYELSTYKSPEYSITVCSHDAKQNELGWMISDATIEGLVHKMLVRLSESVYPAKVAA